MITYAPRRHGPEFDSVLGFGRGLDVRAHNQRDFAELDVEDIVNNTDINVLIEYFYRFRNHSHAKTASLHTGLAARLANDIWVDWTQRGMSSAMGMLGLSLHEESPWLLRDTYAASDVSGPTIIHIADWRMDRPWVESKTKNRKHLRSLCGLPRYSQSQPRAYARFMPRGSWHPPLKAGTLPCPTCERRAQKLIIPALDDQIIHVRSHSFMNSGFPRMQQIAESALRSSDNAAEVYAVLSESARASTILRLREVARADPIPVFMHVLAVGERSHLHALSQPHLHRLLSDFNWLETLEASLATAHDGEPNTAFFHDTLAAHAQSLHTLIKSRKAVGQL